MYTIRSRGRPGYPRGSFHHGYLNSEHFVTFALYNFSVRLSFINICRFSDIKVSLFTQTTKSVHQSVSAIEAAGMMTYFDGSNYHTLILVL